MCTIMGRRGGRQAHIIATLLSMKDQFAAAALCSGVYC